MSRFFARTVLSLGVALSSLSALSAADTPPPSCEQIACRADVAQHVACYGVPSKTKSYTGYYVGGGCACFGHPRSLTDGTWGWDYRGCLLPHKIYLKWCHRCQGGTGAYA